VAEEGQGGSKEEGEQGAAVTEGGHEEKDPEASALEAMLDDDSSDDGDAGEENKKVDEGGAGVRSFLVHVHTALLEARPQAPATTVAQVSSPHPSGLFFALLASVSPFVLLAHPLCFCQQFLQLLVPMVARLLHSKTTRLELLKLAMHLSITASATPAPPPAMPGTPPM
jgi:hypothetical protein